MVNLNKWVSIHPKFAKGYQPYAGMLLKTIPILESYQSYALRCLEM